MPVVPKKAGPGSPPKKGSKVKKAGDHGEGKQRMMSIIGAEDNLYHEPIKKIIKPANQVCM